MDILDLLRSERFRNAWARLDAAEHADRMAALEGIRRMLGSSGLNLQDVLSRATAEPAPDPRRSAGSRSHDVDPFRGFGRHAPSNGGSDTREVTGDRIPARIIGRVRVRYRSHQGQDALVIVIDDGTRTFGPLVAHEPGLIEMLTTASDTGNRVRAGVSPRSGAGTMPLVYTASIVLF